MARNKCGLAAGAAGHRDVGPAPGHVDRVLRAVLGDPVVRQHDVGLAVQNVGLAVEVDRQYRVGQPPERVPHHDDSHLIVAESEFQQAGELEDGEVLAVAGAAQELQRRRPIVAPAIEYLEWAREYLQG